MHSSRYLEFADWRQRISLCAGSWPTSAGGRLPATKVRRWNFSREANGRILGRSWPYLALQAGKARDYQGIVNCPTQLIYIVISICCQHTCTKDIAGQSANQGTKNWVTFIDAFTIQLPTLQKRLLLLRQSMQTWRVISTAAALLFSCLQIPSRRQDCSHYGEQTEAWQVEHEVLCPAHACYQDKLPPPSISSRLDAHKPGMVMSNL